MGVELEEDLITALLDEADTLLAEFVTDGGAMVFPLPRVAVATV